MLRYGRDRIATSRADRAARALVNSRRSSRRVVGTGCSIPCHECVPR